MHHPIPRALLCRLLPLVLAAGCVRFKTDLGKLPESSYRTIDHDDQGGVSEVELTRAATVEDLALPAGTRLRFDAVHGDIATIFTRESVVVHGMTVPASSRIDLRVPAGRSSHEVIAIELGAEMSQGDAAFVAGDVLSFEGGRFASARLHGGRAFGGKDYPADADLWFNDSGEVTKVVTRGERERAQARVDDCNTQCAPVVDSYQHDVCMTRCLP